jgi:TfoX/Sxy family transcriptional regulator of competence genes
MEFDEKATARVRRALARRRAITEKKMMGALCFLSGGTMCCGITGSALMVRVGRDAFDQALERPHVRPLEFAQRRARGFILVDPPGYRTEIALTRWLEQGLAVAKTLRAGPRNAPPPSDAPRSDR